MARSTPTSLPFTGEAPADKLLASNPLALLIGMLLDQQYPMEAAFRGPYTVQQRLAAQGVSLDATSVAAMDPDTLASLYAERPAVHRYPGSMAQRSHQLAQAIVETYGGDPAAIWTTAADGTELYKRLRKLPGFGEAKARIFIGILGKRMQAAPAGWEAEAADWPSVADVDTFAKIAEIREAKREMKAAAKAATAQKASGANATKTAKGAAGRSGETTKKPATAAKKPAAAAKKPTAAAKKPAAAAKKPKAT